MPRVKKCLLGLCRMVPSYTLSRAKRIGACAESQSRCSQRLKMQRPKCFQMPRVKKCLRGLCRVVLSSTLVRVKCIGACAESSSRCSRRLKMQRPNSFRMPRGKKFLPIHHSPPRVYIATSEVKIRFLHIRFSGPKCGLPPFREMHWGLHRITIAMLSAIKDATSEVFSYV